jgi:uncharacterized protein (UPF0332 family)
MDPREFHKLAARLAAGSSAAEYRTAIGRAYYAAFNVGAEWLRALGFALGKGPAAHGEVQRCLVNSGDAQVSDAGAKISRLHSQRIRADYHLGAADVEIRANANFFVNFAGEIIRTLDAAFSGPHRAQLQSAIAKWRRDNGYP